MSYILDALKKAERDRPKAKIPTLRTVHQTSAAPGRRLWPGIVALVVLVNAGVLIWLLRSGPMLSTEIPPSSPATPAVSPPAAVPEQAAPAPPAGPAPRVSAPEPPTPAATASPLPSPPRPEPTRPAAPKRVEAGRGPSVALAPAAPKAEPADARVSPPPRPAPEKPALSTPTPPVPAVASTPNRPNTAPVPPSPPMPGGSLPAVGDSQEFIRKMRLQVVVYSDVPGQRLVFIDNHKYVEGQSIGGNVLVESITPDGAILIYQGKRFKLRAAAD